MSASSSKNFPVQAVQVVSSGLAINICPKLVTGADGEALADAEGLLEEEGESDGDAEAEILEDGLAEELGDKERETEALGLSERLAEEEGLKLRDTDELGLAEEEGD